MLPWVGGNIGNPLITDLSYMRTDDIAVIELSSFQLELVSTSPRIAAILNITPNHLDRHKTMENYIAAKSNIILNQKVGDAAVLNRDEPHTARLAGRVSAELALFSKDVPLDVGAWLVGDRIVCRAGWDKSLEPICSVDEIRLRGAHNVSNVLAATAIAGVAGVSPEAIRKGILDFSGVEHRLEVVRNWLGVTYVNDSIATAPERVLAAINAFTEPLVLLLGGRDKNLPWEDMLRIAVRRARAVITFGEAGMMIAGKAAEAREIGGFHTVIEQTNTLEEAFWVASREALDGDVVLLSPGCTSFDQYEDFAARGEHFRSLVKGM
jgi:UDP-N-acetylmuramoylalanine--D-glutamate ligase